MRLVINADDFGWDDETVDATIRCFEEGGLTSATIMAGMPGCERAAAYARDNPRFSFGAHLTWVGDGPERPVAPARELPGLTDAQGRFLASNSVRKRALRGDVRVDEIAREASAQIQKLVDLGVRLSHVDSHGHLHKFGPFREALRTVLPKYGIRRVRTVQDVYLKKPIKSPTYWLGWYWKRRVDGLFSGTEHLYLPSSAWDDDSWPGRLLESSSRLGGTLEVGLHPGTREDWRRLELDTGIVLGRMARERGIPMATWNEVGAG